MNIKTVKVGMLETNCYIIDNSEECIIIDPGDEFEKIKNRIDKKVVGILLTHRHFDHIGALKDVIDYYNVSFFDKNNLCEGENIIEGLKFKVIYNPGHTIDSISFIFNDVMFSGDFVFEGCIGRWDLGGDFNLMKKSIKRLLESKINYKIYPGHGNITTLENEKNMLESYLK